MLKKIRKLVSGSLILVSLGCNRKVAVGNNSMINLNLPVAIQKIDPHHMEDAYSMLLSIQVYRGLFRYLSNGDLKLDLVEDYKKDESGLIYTFKLKPNLIFSNNEPIKSIHVLHSLARIYYTGSSISADLDYIAGADEFKKSKKISDLKIEIINDREFKIHLSHASNLFVKHLATADCAVLPITDFKITELPKVFSGPYKVSSQTANSIELEKWRVDPLDSKNPPRKINFFNSPENAFKLANDKKTDWLIFDHINKDDASKLVAQGWFKTASEMTLENFLIISPDYFNIDTRKKIGKIINQMSFNLGYDNLEKAFGLIPPIFNGVLKNSDLDKFYELPIDESKIKKEIIFSYNSEIDITTQTAMAIKNELEKNHFKVTLEPLKTSALLDKMFTKKAQLILGRKGVDYPDPLSILNYYKAGVENNYFYTTGTKLNQLINQLIVENDENRKHQLYVDAQKEILKEFTFFPLYFGTDSLSLWSTKFKMIPPFPTGPHMINFEMVEMN